MTLSSTLFQTCQSFSDSFVFNCVMIMARSIFANNLGVAAEADLFSADVEGELVQEVEWKN